MNLLPPLITGRSAVPKVEDVIKFVVKCTTEKLFCCRKIQGHLPQLSFSKPLYWVIVKKGVPNMDIFTYAYRLNLVSIKEIRGIFTHLFNEICKCLSGLLAIEPFNGRVLLRPAIANLHLYAIFIPQKCPCFFDRFCSDRSFSPKCTQDQGAFLVQDCTL